MSFLLSLKGAWFWIKNNVILALVAIILIQVIVGQVQCSRIRGLKNKIDRIVKPVNPDGRRRILPIFREDEVPPEVNVQSCINPDCTCDPCICEKCTCTHCACEQIN